MRCMSENEDEIEENISKSSLKDYDEDPAAFVRGKNRKKRNLEASKQLRYISLEKNNSLYDEDNEKDNSINMLLIVDESKENVKIILIINYLYIHCYQYIEHTTKVKETEKLNENLNKNNEKNMKSSSNTMISSNNLNITPNNNNVTLININDNIISSNRV